MIRLSHGALACVPLAAIGWTLWQTRDPRAPGSTVVRLAVVGGVILLPLAWTVLRMRRSAREMDAALRGAGIDPDEVPEEPLPLVPRLRLAKDRDQLAAGVVFLVLLVLVLVAHYRGWVARWMGDPVEPGYVP